VRRALDICLLEQKLPRGLGDPIQFRHTFSAALQFLLTDMIARLIARVFLDICVHQGVSDLAPPRRDASDVNQREPPTLGHPLEEPPTAFTYLGVEKFFRGSRHRARTCMPLLR